MYEYRIVVGTNVGAWTPLTDGKLPPIPPGGKAETREVFVPGLYHSKQTGWVRWFTSQPSSKWVRIETVAPDAHAG